MAAGLSEQYARYRYAILFYSLLLSLVLSPLLGPLGLSGNLFEAFLAVNLLAAILAVGESRLRAIALVVLAIALVMRPGAAWMNQENLSLGSLTAWAILAVLAIASALRFALRGQSVGGEQIYAALSAYLLAGFFFGLAYWVIEQLAPGSVATAAGPQAGGLTNMTATYFSFVTIASLGYGDVLPLSDPARGIAIIEVVSGQLYLAVMVARLVGAWR